MQSAIFLFRASVAPFEGRQRVEALKKRFEEIMAGLGEIELRSRPKDDKPAPTSRLDLPGYLKERVDYQMDWYQQRCDEFQGQSDRYRWLVLLLGGVAAVLGLASSSGIVSTWAAAIATATAAITAHVKNQRFQTLMGTYQATRLRLGLLKDELSTTDPSKAASDAFIQRCEETLAAENGAWVGLWSKPSVKTAQPPAPPPTEPADAS
jgi:hypothetical protein